MELLNRKALLYAYSVIPPSETVQAVKRTDGPDCELYITDKRVFISFEFGDNALPDGLYVLPSHVVASERNYDMGFKLDSTGLGVLVSPNGEDIPLPENPKPLNPIDLENLLAKSERKPVLARFRWPQNEAIDLRLDNAVDIVCTQAILGMRTIKNPSGEVESGWVVPAAAKCGQDFGQLTVLSKYMTPLFSEPDCEVVVKALPLGQAADKCLVSIAGHNFKVITSTASTASRKASCYFFGSDEFKQTLKEIEEMGTPTVPAKPTPPAAKPAPKVQTPAIPPKMPAAKNDPAIPPTPKNPPPPKAAVQKPPVAHKPPAVVAPKEEPPAQEPIAKEVEGSAPEAPVETQQPPEAPAEAPQVPEGEQGQTAVVETAPTAPPVILDGPSILAALDALIVTAKSIISDANAMKKGLRLIVNDRATRTTDKLSAEIETLKAALAKEKEAGKANAIAAKTLASMQKAMANYQAPAAP